MYLFCVLPISGDPRIGLNPELTSMEILFVRAHNVIAASLWENHLNEWDDERTFKETRRVLIAFYKQIVFAELIPAYIGGTPSIAALKIS
jgi:hypothetical protein